ncbi:hypothetical protein MPTK1_1g01730 [Marchantia polymorpha subsp. ruderalis]|uniref:Uncharacterized protein n=2 Tax=Marchantia polymorpha TaxID=3197 RepID=A0AAF6AKG9_MARPO|nr:hypothetical protein MARPO_0029s0072 [Marchantia polymorpha]BBM96939.1 hypothetical protein Mp_1g01730 [Marchantia polymorpha subsp. ruderalis]|eukprot:PTQ42542.1 hypothetical protein MARPO_0029s0072 [Marchantia polymorpha]
MENHPAPHLHWEHRESSKFSLVSSVCRSVYVKLVFFPSSWVRLAEENDLQSFTSTPFSPPLLWISAALLQTPQATALPWEDATGFRGHTLE